jgi:hypothetical protein
MTLQSTEYGVQHCMIPITLIRLSERGLKWIISAHQLGPLKPRNLVSGF